MADFTPRGSWSDALNHRPKAGGISRVSSTPLLIATVFTCSGLATPVRFVNIENQTPTDEKVRLCWEKVKYIDGESARPLSKLESPPAPGAFRCSATSRSESGYGSGLSSTLSRTVKTDVLAPMPIAS